MADEIATLLKYANLQMAAEALFGVFSSMPAGTGGLRAILREAERSKAT